MDGLTPHWGISGLEHIEPALATLVAVPRRGATQRVV
jgi:hypothetical protein